MKKEKLLEHANNFRVSKEPLGIYCYLVNHQIKNNITATINQISATTYFLSVFFFPLLAATTPPINAIAIAIQVQKVIDSPLS
ncbi:hypothetical protein SAMN05216179_0166 [Gracilibacillus kekensis]|uniref:Uncharacterized protein n=1 Tax=Gracilibacillus kekensis TaxID=1027249 RepID=A0A1M7IVF4_9BACI|nr:hypothetical protein SAMN05216179_0166 [Gracilibacillus kekensis]